jgi:LacI family transcriptional regulator
VEEKISKTAGIKEIARALGISIGTVDRALHDRPGISPNTRAKVLRMAERLQYRPNVAARNLKLNRRLRIAVHTPREIASFFDPLREGVRAAAAATAGVKLDVDFRTFPRLGDGDLKLMEEDLDRDYDGLLITPGHLARAEPIIRRFVDKNVAVICVASDVPRSGRLAAVSVDAAVSGGMAAELLGRVLRAEGNIAVITGDLNTFDHSEKLRGFAATLATTAPHLTLLPAVESHEQPKEAYTAALRLLKRRPRPAAIYISTANSVPVLRALDEQRLLGRMEVIATDLFPQLAALLESGAILATIYQRPYTQGKVAFEAMFRFLVGGASPDPVTRLAPHLILRSNLPLFLSSEADRAAAARGVETNL